MANPHRRNIAAFLYKFMANFNNNKIAFPDIEPVTDKTPGIVDSSHFYSIDEIEFGCSWHGPVPECPQ
jgi:hypothetical protein